MTYRNPSRVGRFTAAVTVAVGLLIPVAVSAADPPALGKPTIAYAAPSWASGRMITEVGRILLEKVGYKVEVKLLDTGVIYQSLAAGKMDVFSVAWLPGQQSYFNKFGDSLEILSMSYGPVPGGLMVPTYLDASSIEDLKKPDVRKALGGKIVGIDAGSGLMLQTQKVLKEYNLDYELVTSSGAAMEASFKGAYQKQTPIVVTGWCPHYLCAAYKVKFLDDPKNVYGDARDYHVVRKGFRADFPRATLLLSRINLFEEQISKMLVWSETEKITPEQAAQRFIDNNPIYVWYLIGDLTTGLQKPASLQ
jgi:glycine betaine/proline transport system substrate-binding protein